MLDLIGGDGQFASGDHDLAVISTDVHYPSGFPDDPSAVAHPHYRWTRTLLFRIRTLARCSRHCWIFLFSHVRISFSSPFKIRRV